MNFPDRSRCNNCSNPRVFLWCLGAGIILLAKHLFHLLNKSSTFFCLDSLWLLLIFNHTFRCISSREGDKLTKRKKHACTVIAHLIASQTSMSRVSPAEMCKKSFSLYLQQFAAFCLFMIHEMHSDVAVKTLFKAQFAPKVTECAIVRSIKLILGTASVNRSIVGTFSNAIRIIDAITVLGF